MLVAQVYDDDDGNQSRRKENYEFKLIVNSERNVLHKIICA